MAHDLYSGKRPPEPTEPGACLCATRYPDFHYPDCPRHGQAPVLTPTRWADLDVIATRDPQETWNLARELSWWARDLTPTIVRPVYVIDDGVHWVAADVRARNEEENWAEYTFATLGGGFRVFELPTRHLDVDEWNYGIHRTVPLRTLRDQHRDQARRLIDRIRHGR